MPREAMGYDVVISTASVSATRAARSGEPRTAPSAFGNEHYPPRQPALGIHVRERQGQRTAASPLLQPPKGDP